MNGSQVLVSKSLRKSWGQYDNAIGNTLVISQYNHHVFILFPP